SRSQGLAAKMQAGEYSLNTGMSVPEIIRRITGGEVDTLVFTIPEGYNLKQITDTLVGKGLVDRARFTELLAGGNFNYDFLQGLPAGEKRLEGYLFPDTYHINKGTTEEEIMNIMLARFAREITPEFKQKAGALGLTLHQAVTLASVIEREAAKDEERPRVAAVFLNRMKKGWKLESCATVQYALGTNKTRLLYKDLQVESPYNTYKYKGLPPGPIAAPGRASLLAAVNPAKEDYMFFVVSEEGQHVFSRTIQEHNRNKAKYISRFKTP
ncbi:MAG: endolytic transglycosylase MltG, partial [Bacillota bacterium]